MEKRALKGKKNRTLLLNRYHKFQRNLSDVLTQSTQISRAPSNFFNTQSQKYRISITDYVVLDDQRDTHSTFYRSVSSIKRKIYQNATNLVINPLFFCLDFHSRMNTRKKEKRYSSSFVSIFSYSFSFLVVNADRHMPTR